MEDRDTVYTQDQTITCDTCGATKPRSEYRQVANPTKCKLCIANTRATERQRRIDDAIAEALVEQKADGALAPIQPKQPSETGDNARGGSPKPRVSVYLTPFALSVLNFLSAKKNQSDTVEQLLAEKYNALDPQVQEMVRYIHEQGIM